MPSHFQSPQRIARLTPLDDLLARVDALVQPVAPRNIKLAAALGRTLARDVIITETLPNAALALRDGWALRSDLTIDASSYAPAPIPGAQWINAGEILPADADAVAPLDVVLTDEGEAQAIAPVAPSEGVLPAGSDFRTGIILASGRRIRPVAIAALTCAGISEAAVREPSVQITRARERADPVIDGAIGCIADAVRRLGGIAVIADGQPLEHALNNQAADAVIVVGGTGTGRNDGAITALASHGKLVAHGIGLNPGDSSGFAMMGRRPALALPGRFDAALAAWHMLGRHIVGRLAGNIETLLLRSARLTHKVTSVVGMAELVPVRCAGACATPIASGYVPLGAMAEANGWLFIKAESEGHPAGHEVMIRPWP